MPRNCTVVENCIDCPAIPSTPSQSAQVIVNGAFGWTAGANSLDELDGNVRVAFSVTPPTLGLVVGFKTDRQFVTSPTRCMFGFYLTTVSGMLFYNIVELGAQKIANAHWYSETDVFEIRRVNGVVTYVVNDEIVYTSATTVYGPLLVNACLYGVGDSVQ